MSDTTVAVILPAANVGRRGRARGLGVALLLPDCFVAGPIDAGKPLALLQQRPGPMPRPRRVIRRKWSASARLLPDEGFRWFRPPAGRPMRRLRAMSQAGR